VRIALVAPLVTPIREPQLGGSQALVADLARGLTDRGHDVAVFAATGSAIAGVSVIDTGVDAGELAGLLYRADHPAASASQAQDEAFRRAFELVRQSRYDVVHNHAFDAPAVRCALAVASPVVHTLHLPPDAGMASAINEAFDSSNPPTVVAVSASSAAGWRELTRVDRVLRDGVPVDRISWSGDAGRGLIFAGRFSPEKGAADAIAIARRAGVPIDLYGDPYDADYAREQVESRRGDPGVAIHRAIPREELWRLMAAARAVLCPSRWEEPFGIVAAEAQAAGTPVIAYGRGALPEVVLDQRTGFIVPPDDIDTAAAAVEKVDQISRVACRQHAEADLNLEATISAHEQLYADLASGRLREDV
jgi:UDP-glucose:tetrahydrobiopterin glucosyltransferase